MRLLTFIRAGVIIPRNHRFVLGERIERNPYDLLEILIRAKYTRQGQGLLEQANLILETLRFQMRLAKGLQCLEASHEGPFRPRYWPFSSSRRGLRRVTVFQRDAGDTKRARLRQPQVVRQVSDPFQRDVPGVRQLCRLTPKHEQRP